MVAVNGCLSKHARVCVCDQLAVVIPGQQRAVRWGLAAVSASWGSAATTVNAAPTVTMVTPSVSVSTHQN